MATKRRYDQKQKLSAVLAADLVGVTAAAEQTGIPHQTISYWLDDPKFSDIRRKTREDLADEIKTVAHLAWQRVAQTIGQMEPRDALFAAEKATSLQLLMSGEATARTESRELTEPIVDDAALDAAEAAYLRVLESPTVLVEANGKGAASNGHSGLRPIRLPGASANGHETPKAGAEGATNGHQPNGRHRGEMAG